MFGASMALPLTNLIRLGSRPAALAHSTASASMKKGFAFRMDKKGYAEFCGRFPYEETLDQEKAENAVLADMESERPMDRSLCGY